MHEPVNTCFIDDEMTTETPPNQSSTSIAVKNARLIVIHNDR